MLFLSVMTDVLSSGWSYAHSQSSRKKYLWGMSVKEVSVFTSLLMWGLCFSVLSWRYRTGRYVSDMCGSQYNTSSNMITNSLQIIPSKITGKIDFVTDATDDRCYQYRSSTGIHHRYNRYHHRTTCHETSKYFVPTKTSFCYCSNFNSEIRFS